VATARPAAWPAHSVLKLFLSATDPAGSSLILLGVLNPTDELVASQGGDVLPTVQREVVCEQGLPQVSWKFVDDSARNALATHRKKIPPSLV